MRWSTPAGACAIAGLLTLRRAWKVASIFPGMPLRRIHEQMLQDASSASIGFCAGFVPCMPAAGRMMGKAGPPGVL